MENSHFPLIFVAYTLLHRPQLSLVSIAGVNIQPPERRPVSGVASFAALEFLLSATPDITAGPFISKFFMSFTFTHIHAKTTTEHQLVPSCVRPWDTVVGREAMLRSVCAKGTDINRTLFVYL